MIEWGGIGRAGRRFSALGLAVLNFSRGVWDGIDGGPTLCVYMNVAGRGGHENWERRPRLTMASGAFLLTLKLCCSRLLSCEQVA